MLFDCFRRNFQKDLRKRSRKRSFSALFRTFPHFSEFYAKHYSSKCFSHGSEQDLQKGVQKEVPEGGPPRGFWDRRTATRTMVLTGSPAVLEPTMLFQNGQKVRFRGPERGTPRSRKRSFPSLQDHGFSGQIPQGKNGRDLPERALLVAVLRSQNQSQLEESPKRQPSLAEKSS